MNAKKAKALRKQIKLIQGMSESLYGTATNGPTVLRMSKRKIYKRSKREARYE